MSRAGFHFQSRLRRSFRAWPHGVADSWGSASLHPRLLSNAPSALKSRYFRPQSKPVSTDQENRPPGSNIITDTASFSDLSFLFATNVEIDPELIKAALSLGGKRSKRAVIDEALREYVLRRQQRDIIKLFGSIDYDESYDYKKQRSRR